MDIDYRIILPHQREEDSPYLDVFLEAFSGDKKIGHIRAEWISKPLIPIIFPTVWHYVTRFKGRTVISYDPEKRTYHDIWENTPLLNIWKRAFSYEIYGFRPPSQRGLVGPGQSLKDCNPTQQEMIDDLDALAQARGYYEDFEDFKKRAQFVYVGYSKVDDGNRWPLENTFNYQGQGIGSNLYKLMAMWLATNLNTSLHQSTLCNPKAVRVWRRLAEEGNPVFKDRKPTTNKHVFSIDYTITPLLQRKAALISSRIPEIGHPKFPTVHVEPFL